MSVFILNIGIFTYDSYNSAEARAVIENESPCWGAGITGNGRYVECPTCKRVLHYIPTGPSLKCTADY